MKKSLALKTLVRALTKTVFTFILIGALSFGLCSQISEYVMSSRELAANKTLYSGTLKVKDGYKWLEEYEVFYFDFRTVTNEETYTEEALLAGMQEDGTVIINDDWILLQMAISRGDPVQQETMEKLSNMPYVTYSDTRYMTAGISSEYMRLFETTNDVKDHIYSITSPNDRLIIEGTLAEKNDRVSSAIRSSVRGADTEASNALVFEDCTLLGGTCPIDIEGRTLEVTAYTLEEHEDEEEPYKSYSDADYRRISSIYGNYKYGQSYQDEMKIGDRYVFVVRYLSNFRESREYNLKKSDPRFAIVEPDACLNTLVLYDEQTEDVCPSVWNVTDAPENYTELEEYAPLKALLELTYDDAHTFDMIYTKDMEAIPQIADGTMNVYSGRPITVEDTENANRVCVVSNLIAETYGLSVGDTITMTLGTKLMDRYVPYGAVAGTFERYTKGEEVTLEIVGLYNDTDINTRLMEPFANYSKNSIFVPASLLSVDESEFENHNIYASDFSVVVDNADDIAKFANECLPELEESEIENVYYDRGWTVVAESYDTSKTVSLIRIAVFGGMTVIATAFVVFLFITRKKKDYAIMRALGTERRRAGETMLLPLMVLDIAAVTVGCVSAWIYAVNTHTVSATLAALDNFVAASGKPVWVVFACIAAEIAIAFIFAALMLRALGKKSPLALLQNSGGKDKKKAEKSEKKKEAEAVPKPAIEEKVEFTYVASASFKRAAESTPVKSKNTVGFVWRYILRHAKRSLVKSILTMLVAALIVGAVCQYLSMQKAYKVMEENTAAVANFTSGMTAKRIAELYDMGYIRDSYYYTMELADLDFDGRWIAAIVTDDIARVLETDKFEIEFYTGYDESCMKTFDNILIMPVQSMEEYGYSLGDKVRLSNYQSVRGTKLVAADRKLTEEELMEKLMENSLEYTIVGQYVITDSELDLAGTVFAPGSADYMKSPFSYARTLSFASLTLTGYDYIDEMQSYAEERLKDNISAFSMDTKALETVVKTSNLLKTLYPLVIAATLIIGSFLCALIIIQTSKDAAIMRIQGTTKRKTRAILAIEQIMLTILGAVVGVLAMAVIKGAAFTETAPQTLVFAGVYIVVTAAAAVISAVFATHKNILELLQTKE